MKTALIAGATGLIGRQLLHLLLQDTAYNKVIALSRRPLEIDNPKLETIITEIDEVKDRLAGCLADDVFCCLGTTMKIAGSKQAFRKVDFTYPAALVAAAKAMGVKQFMLVSSLGAHKASSIFYNQVKGETEEVVLEAGFETVHIVRPSMLLGDRTEHRPSEDAAKFVFRYLGFLIPKKYDAIDSAKVASALITLARENKKGTFIHESKALQNY